MPVQVTSGAPTLFIRKAAFERVGLTRKRLDERLNLTADEFRVERDLIVVGPIHATDDLPSLFDELEELGLVYFDEFFELSGGWPEWLRLFATGDSGGG